MKQFSKLLAICLPAVIPAFAHDIRISTFDADRTPPSSLSGEEYVSSNTAELILARRLGRSESGVVGQVDEKVLQDLNKYGGSQPDLFGGDSEKIGRMLLIVEGADDVDGATTQAKSTGDIVVPQAPPNLIPSFHTLYNSALQKGPLCSHECSTDGNGLGCKITFRVPDGSSCPKLDDFHADGLPGLMSKEPLYSAARRMPVQFNIYSDPEVLSGLQQDHIAGIVSAMHTLSTEAHIEITAVFLPSGYPQTFSSSSSSEQHHQQSRRSAGENIFPRSPNEQKQRRAVSSLMPICHASNNSCNEATNNCSGHGYCYKRRASNGKDSDTSGECYACKCNRTVVRSDDEGNPVKTIQWGGPACQKKDVSMPFWLLGGFSVLLVGIIAAVVGMMMRMGGEELPSVLGAGVSAVKK